MISRISDSGDLGGNLASRAMIQPFAKKVRGHTMYGFTARGYVWLYRVSSHSKADWHPRSSLSKKNELPIILDAPDSIE